MDSTVPLNTLVTVRVTRAIPSGLLGKVGERRAIIRRREIAWDAQVSYDHYVGQTRQAVVIGYNPAYDELELSLRLVVHDPWAEAASKYRFGTIVEGRVVGLTRDAAYVEIEPGIEGLLHVSELLPQPVEGIESLLWIDDRVKALVLDVDPARRRLRLSIRELLVRRETDYRKHIWSRYQDAASRTTVAAAVPEQIRLQLYQLHEKPPNVEQNATLDILVVEDDAAYGQGLRSLLQRNGCAVVVVQDAIGALQEVHSRSRPFDLILIDWGLPDIIKGHELVQILQKEGVASRLAMVMEPAPVADRRDVWQALEEANVDVFLKSDDDQCQAGIIGILAELRGSAAPARHSPTAMRAGHRGSSLDADERPTLLALPGHEEAVQNILDRLQKDTRASTVAVIALSPSGHLEVISQSGQTFPFDQAPPDAIYSPLGDVLQAGAEVWETVIGVPPRFERLLKLAPFQSFIGVPLPRIEESRRGLILLRQQGSFRKSDMEMARVTAYMLARTMLSNSLIKSLQPWQGQHLAGQITASAIHEIDNKLSATKLNLDSVRQQVAELWKYPHKASDTLFLQKMEDELNTIALAWAEADSLRKQYLSLTGGWDDVGTLDINSIISGMVHLLQVEAKSRGITLTTELAKGLPHVRGSANQVRQILWNLALNAIQQMAEARRQGRITIATRYAVNSPRPVQIRVTDDGPGIHFQLWQRIFDFGFSTRKGGSGLGLTICQQTARSLGGELRLEESYVLWGTTFVLELPQEVGT